MPRFAVPNASAPVQSYDAAFPLLRSQGPTATVRGGHCDPAYVTSCPCGPARFRWAKLELLAQVELRCSQPAIRGDVRGSSVPVSSGLLGNENAKALEARSS